MNTEQRSYGGAFPSLPAIAIVGMACEYPDARSPLQLWENALAQRQAFRRIPSDRLNLADYYSPDKNAGDRTYSTAAALLEGYDFDRVNFQIVGSTFRSADLTHWLALDIASRALTDAGFANAENLPRESTGVLLGNTLTGEFSRANTLRMRWPYVRRVVEAQLIEAGYSSPQRQTFLDNLELEYKQPFPEVGDETLAGNLSNTIAGRICNYFDLKGGGYTLDGACSSSLLAVANACSALVAGDLDVALAGGVDLSLDPFELLGFAKVGALAAEEMRVYDVRSAGFLPGEGCGFVVLMRYEDAVTQQRRIYATIRGWGISSDGAGGITRPEVAGQVLALKRAYRRAGFGIDTVAYFEGHGTGTTVGDATELKAISRARRDATINIKPAVIGSIKANIGHTKAAAGVAGLIKATMAVYTGILPPNTSCEQPHAELTDDTPALRILREAECWQESEPMKAGVSSMGFGGINAHLVLEGNRELKHNITLAGTVQDTELVLLGAADANKLKQQVEHLLTIAPRLSRAEVTDLAAELADRLESQNAVRAAIVASSPQELTTCLEILQSWLAEGITHRLNIPAGVFLGTGFNVGRIGFLFPGQASPVYLHDGAWGRRFPVVRELYNMANLSAREDSRSTAVAQPSIVLAEMAGLRVLQQLGITATVGVGHSLGELSALHWAGAIDEASLLQIARIRGRVMAELGSPTGMMASIGADEGTVKELLIDNSAVIAGINSPHQTIVSGDATAVKEIVTRAIAKGLKTTTLPISDAFHSPLVAAAVPPLAEHLAGVKFQPLQQRVVSTITGSLLSSDADIPFLLCRQVTEPVRFIEAINQAIEGVNLLLEVGPGNVLGRMIANFVTVPTVAIDSAGSSLKGLLQGVGAAFCLGTPVDIKSLFAGRFTRPFNLNWQPKFFVNPCERHNTYLNADARKAFSDGIAEMIAQQLDVNAIPRKEINCERERHNTYLNADARKAFSDGIAEMIAQQLDVNAIPRKEINCERERYDKDLDADTRKVSSADSSNIFNPYIRVQNPCSARIATNKSPLDCIRELVAKRAELPLEAIREDSHLLGDLHLNSITVGQLVAEAARSLDLLPPVAPTDYADATVGEVAKALAELASTGSSTAVAEEKISPLGVDAWIRTFTVNLVETPLLRLAKSLDKVGFWQIIAPSNYWRKASLEKAFASCEGSGVVVCLPPEVDESCVDLLLASAKVVLSDTEQKFVLVQQGGVGAAFARTLHLEMPKLTTCVVNLPQECLEAEEIIVAEARSVQGYSEAHYDESGKRRSPHLQLLSIPDRQDTRFSLSNDDVLLVTGGGKGIAAECALAIAKETGVRLALLGRSNPKTDSELATNLQRMTAAGIKFIYITTDVSNSQAVERTVSDIETKLGAVTAIIHGAGVNKPRLIKSLEKEDFLSTLAPKVRGLENILASVNPEKLRLLVTFGSIIARMGLPGEADYAIANEWLGYMVESFATNYPNCHCLNLDWSVWSGVGMGERLGRIDTLMQQGITPIPADTGIEILQRLIGASIPKNSVVVTGRFGEPPTLKMERPELPFLRFLEQPRVYYPGVELVVDAELSLENDPYLQDHVFQDEYILPGVMGLEAMAQGAIALLEMAKPPIFENVKFPRPVVVSPDKPLKIRIAALVREFGKVDVVLRCEQTAFSVDHFQATLVADVATDGGMNGRRHGVADVATDGGMNGRRHGVADVAADGVADGGMGVSVRPEVDLYGGIFFHQGRFQRLQGYRYLRSQECVGEIAVDNRIQWFSRYLPDRLILGDPGARDTVIHSLQACIPHARLLPIGVERLIIHKVERCDSQFVVAKERMRQGDTFIYDLQVVEKDGKLLEVWQGLQLKVVGKTEVEKNWSAALLAPYMERQLKEFIPSVDVRVVVDADATVERQMRSDRAFQQALGTTLSINRRLDGKPEVIGEWDISAAHTGNITLAVASAKPISCDLEKVVARSPQTWQDLLGSDRDRLAQMLVREVGEDLNASATRVWTAIECLKKASTMVTTPLVLAETIKDGWVLLKAGSLTIATFAASVREMSNPLVLAVLVSNKTELAHRY